MSSKNYLSRKDYIINARGYKIFLGPRTLIMGIVNMTPDSFSQDGLLIKKSTPTSHSASYALGLIRKGADIIDIGGESTRPGAIKISPKEELKRIIPTIQLLTKKTKIPISVDTYKPEVAEKALYAGACIVNNVCGTQLTQSMLKIIKKYQATVVLMHMKGKPRTMQKKILYTRDIVLEIIQKLKISIEKCLENGIKSDRIIIDPGIGFGKTVQHNLEIIQRLGEFKILNKPILIGTSRKSFIGHILQKCITQRLIGTTASSCAAIALGAHILRVHDVSPMKEAALMMDSIFSKK